MQKSGWILTTKPTDPKPRNCLANILFYLTRRICTIVENENIKEKHLLKKTLLEQKHPKSRIAATINDKILWEF